MALLKQTSPMADPAAPKPVPSKKVPSASINPPRENTFPALAEWAGDESLMGRPRICAKIGMQAVRVNQNLSCYFNRLELSTCLLPPPVSTSARLLGRPALANASRVET